MIHGRCRGKLLATRAQRKLKDKNVKIAILAQLVPPLNKTTTIGKWPFREMVLTQHLSRFSCRKGALSSLILKQAHHHHHRGRRVH